MSIKLVVLGAAGRMGRQLLRLAIEDEAFTLIGGTTVPADPLLGQDLGTLAGLPSTDLALQISDEELLGRADVVVDFTQPSALAGHAALVKHAGVGWILGTTGLSAGDQKLVEDTAKQAPVMQAANFALGVNLLLALVTKAAARLDESWDIEILEMHHNQKVDAPSGTALALGEAAATGRQGDFHNLARLSREGHTGKRPKGEIGFATLRGGTMAGEHEVIFASDSERLILAHKASDRVIFAKGALFAARWIKGKVPGLYSLADALEPSN